PRMRPHRRPAKCCSPRTGSRKTMAGGSRSKGARSRGGGANFLGLSGRTGAGKTPSSVCLPGSTAPPPESCALAGPRRPPGAAHRLARLGMARTFQVPRPFGRLTVYENALLGCLVGEAHSAADREERIRNTLQAVGLGALSDKPANSLGPSQLRLLEVARALV